MPTHDVGKIGIPDNILMKLGKLTDEAFDFMKTHTTYRSKNISRFKSRDPATCSANCHLAS